MSKAKERNGSTVATTYEFNFPQPKEKVPLKYILYNPKDGTILGRTAASWSKIIFFYLIFYCVLAGLFAICVQGLFATLNDGEPKWKLDSSLIGTNPGLGFRPLSEETEKGSVIQFNHTQPTQGDHWINLLNEFLEPYLDKKKLPGGGQNQKICDFNTVIGPNNVCAVDISKFENCTPEESFGYHNAAPCIFLKLNKIFDWVPEYYDDVDDLPEDMPDDLQQYIRNQTEEKRKQVWVSCKGQYANDKELLKNIEYTPSRGFPSYYYPYRNVQGYLSPLVAVRFSGIVPGRFINVECRAWAKNIIYSGSLRDRMGSVTFQLLMD